MANVHSPTATFWLSTTRFTSSVTVRATHTLSLLMPKVAQINLLPTRTVTRTCLPRFTPALRGPVGYPNHVGRVESFSRLKSCQATRSRYECCEARFFHETRKVFWTVHNRKVIDERQRSERRRADCFAALTCPSMHQGVLG